ncbi:Metallo-dependent phosphatase-like protein [Pisolithus sp. B1]|nr:Metallo-dependent phosphatase-like protein [Pisolithus sp. B1]
MAYDPDKWIAQLMDCQHLPEQDMKILCDTARAILLEESNIQPVSTPVTICGDIHGQFRDLLERRQRARDQLYLHGTLETVSYPDRVTLLRGNYESRQITQVYGFYDERQQKYGSAAVRKARCNVFDYLNLAAIIDGETLCVHGGLSPDICTLDQIRRIPHEGAFCDLVPRGVGWLFGGNVTREFNHVNSLSLIACAHQLVQEGYKYMLDNALVTLWSVPNYCYRCGNMALVLTLREGGEHDFKVFGPALENEKDKGMGRRNPGMQYFV